MPKFEQLVESKVFREVLDTPTEEEVAGLEQLIESEGKCLAPILYHMDELGTPIIVDGYTRSDIFKRRPEIFEEEPATKEVVELSGESEEVVVDWIKKHQAFRRNNEKLIRLFNVGQKVVAKGATVVAKEEGMTRGNVLHAKDLADAVETCEELEEGLKDEILSSNVAASAVKEAAKTGDVNTLKDKIQNGSTHKPKGVQGHFQKIHKLIGQLARAVGGLENETTPNKWSEELKDNINHVSTVVQEWEDAELLGM